MQYHSCVCMFWYAEPQNWFNPGVGRGLYSLAGQSENSDYESCLGQLLHILMFYFNIFV